MANVIICNRQRGQYIHFTEEQKYRANQIDLVNFLQQQGEQLIRSGHEWRWKRYDSVTVQGNRWYRHSTGQGGYAIDFVREFFSMTFPEAISFLLGGECGAEYKAHRETNTMKKKKEFVLPPVHTDMRRVYAYLTKKRFIDREIISHFARAKTLYEDSQYHNAVFVGHDETGKPRHAHKKGTYSEGGSFRANVTGSQPQYSFRHIGESDTLYVFEAPLDLLSYLTLNPKDWQRQSYVALDGVSEYAMLYVLEQNPRIKKIRLCLDRDPAGIEATGRLTEILREKGYADVDSDCSKNKDFNEDLKEMNGVKPIPAKEHPKILGCHEMLDELASICANGNAKSTRWNSIAEDYTTIAYLTQDGRELQPEHASVVLSRLQNMAATALLRVMQDCRQMERPVTAAQLVNHLRKEYAPHKDRSKFCIKLNGIRQTMNNVGIMLNAKGVRTFNDRRKILSDTTRLAFECVKAHTYIRTELRDHKQIQTHDETHCQEEYQPAMTIQ